MSRTQNRQEGDRADEGGKSSPDSMGNFLAEVMQDIKGRWKDPVKLDQPVLVSSVDKQLGALDLIDRTAGPALTSPDQAHRAGDAPVGPDKNIQDTTTHLRSRAEFELQNSHKNARYTLSGASPKVIAYNDALEVKFPQTAFQVAFFQLGWDVSLQQRQAYVHAVEALNRDKLRDDGAGNKVFPAGARIKLPGQNADGGITWRTGEGATTTWYDGSVLFKAADDSGYANYQYAGAGITARWNSAKPEENVWMSGISRGTGLDRYFETTETSVDAQGRTIQRVRRTDKSVPEAIRVIDRAGSVIDLKPGADGEFHGQKTNRGKVLDADAGMTADGRIYSRQKDAYGNTIKKFEQPDPPAKEKDKAEPHGGDVLVSLNNPETESRFSVTRDGTIYSQVKLPSGNLRRAKMAGASSYRTKCAAMPAALSI